jgi:hypothetical protein
MKVQRSATAPLTMVVAAWGGGRKGRPRGHVGSGHGCRLWACGWGAAGTPAVGGTGGLRPARRGRLCRLWLGAGTAAAGGGGKGPPATRCAARHRPAAPAAPYRAERPAGGSRRDCGAGVRRDGCAAAAWEAPGQSASPCPAPHGRPLPCPAPTTGRTTCASPEARERERQAQAAGRAEVSLRGRLTRHLKKLG